MTKRVKQHQLEDLSRLKFGLALPRNWVCRDKDKDYGIDVEVELFDENDRATGLVYWVQLKATESKKSSTIKKIDLSIESIKYFHSLEIPVLIARYSETEDCFYCKWARDIDLFYAKENAKTIRISFDKNAIWNTNSHLEVIEYLGKIRAIKNGVLSFPISISLNIKDDSVNGIPKGVFKSSYRSVLSKYHKIAIFENTHKKALLSITLSGDILKIDLSSLSGCTFHSIKSREETELTEGIVADTLLGCAMALTQIGQGEMAARIVFDTRLKDRFIKKHEILVNMVPYLLKTRFFEETINAVGDIIETEKDNILETIILTSAIFESDPKDESKSKVIETFLTKCLKKYLSLGEDSLTGISFYNLGNHYRSRKLFKKSIEHYLKARKYEKRYLHQSYYFQELAGALFDYGKYYFSSCIYNIALENGAPMSTKPLYADALMFSGKYKLAYDVFEDYLNDNKEDNNAEWHLKMICLETLIKNTSFQEQHRQKKKALKLIDISRSGTEYFIQELEKALEHDMLCGLAWFNLGVEHSRTNHYEDAAFDFIMCSLLQTGDIEAWINAILCCFNKKNHFLLPLVLQTAYFYNEDEFLSKLYQELSTRSDEVSCGILADLVEEVLPKNRDDDNIAIRTLGEDGNFHNLLEKMT